MTSTTTQPNPAYDLPPHLLESLLRELAREWAEGDMRLDVAVARAKHRERSAA